MALDHWSAFYNLVSCMLTSVRLYKPAVELTAGVLEEFIEYAK